MGLFSSLNSWDSVTGSVIGIAINELKKPNNFDRYNEEIEQTKQYIKAKREAFYKNNNLKEK